MRKFYEKSSAIYVNYRGIKMAEELPHVLNALDIMVDHVGITGRLALDLPGDYDWDRVNNLLGHMSIAELEIFCLGTKEDKDAIIREFDSTEEADYALEAVDKVYVMLKKKYDQQENK